MKIYVYPSDRYGCGSFRLIWPGRHAATGNTSLTIEVVDPASRWNIGVNLSRDKRVLDAFAPEDADVIVLQRVTHEYMVQAVPLLRRKGIAVVVDVDDDLTAIHPSNPAFRPQSEQHKWANARLACRDATLVTVSSHALVERYGAHGRVRVLPNYLPEHYYGVAHEDSITVGWPASMHSHPNDPAAVGSALNRLEGAELRFIGLDEVVAEAYRQAFSLREAPQLIAPVGVDEWPKLVATLGVGIAPLADTRFNAAKSWLKPLEMAAVGVPWVGSPRAEYRRFHEESGTGLLASKPADWYRHLSRLVSDESLRRELSEKGRAAAEAYKIADHAWRWAEAWSDALTAQRG